MIPPDFNYHAPNTLDDALTLLGKLGEDAKLLAGGHSLLPMMKLRFAEPEHLIDLNRIDNLRGISESKGTLCIGAMTTENDLIASELLQQKCPLLPEAARLIADPQVRNCGTIGGDIAHGDPGNDHPAIMLALEASFVLQGKKSKRIVPANGFFIDTFHTQLEADEILTEIRIPIAPAHTGSTGSAYHKLKRKTGDFATAAAAVHLQLGGRTCKKINIALTNVAPTAFRASKAEEVLTDQVIDDGLIEKAARLVMSACSPIKDQRGDSEYKTHMAGVMAQRAITSALERAGG